MAQVDTNNVALTYAIETALETPPTSGWRQVEPNDITAFGATLTRTPRRPISKRRGRRKGAVTDKDSSVEFPADLTIDSFIDFAEGFMFAEFVNVEFLLTHSKLKGSALSTDGTAETFLLGAALSTFTNGTLLESKLFYAGAGAKSLLYSRGYVNAVNNGLHVLAADPTTASTALTVSTNLVTETAPANAIVEVAGIRVVDADLTLTVSGSTATLVSGANITNWATLGLKAGQYIHIGSADANGAVQNALQDTTSGSPDDTYGFARIVSISGATLNLDKLGLALDETANNTGTGVADIMFGRFLRNVDTDDAANDERFLSRTYHFEGAYPDLGGAGSPEYEYVKGCAANVLTMNVPLADKATLATAFVATNTEPIVVAGSRKTGPSTALAPLRTTAFNTSSDIASLTTDLIALASDVCFKSYTLEWANGVTPEKCIGTLGAAFTNTGQFTVDLEGQMLFTSKAIINAIQDNTTVTWAKIMRNEDGAIAIDMPSATVSGGGKEFPLDQSVLVNLTLESFTHPTFGHDVGVSMFASVPF